ncbi:hypothetical protein PYS58_06610 [Chryseobacterium indologenes]|uniref:hypothetical protein n=1 Tax=Chryseobacterium indologenes TaxID=253 RepID=UPI0023E79EB2|nr:hypothetical protein [Chryseobacterium indologenes]WET50799.1 hypothetical protein PYS58_06610 [Chryseobacterium indologenes]
MLKTVPRQEIEDRINEIESDKKSPNKISKRLSSPHQITSNTKEWFESAENYWEKRSKKKLILPISVEKKHLSRALLIVDFLVKLLEYRGHSFDLNGRNENIVRISGRDLHISIRNVGKYVNNDQSKYATRDFVFTDVFCIQMYEDTWNRKEWKDTPYSPIEEKLIRVVAYLELFAKYSEEYHRELKEHWRKQDLIRQAEQEKREQAEKEKKDLEQLIVDAENFDRAQKVLNYLKERKKYLQEHNLFTEDEVAYFDWGLNQYLLLNPLYNNKE